MRSPTKVLHNGTPESYGSYSIKTEVEGRYSVCFENPSGTIQKVSFNFLGQDPAVTGTTLSTLFILFNVNFIVEAAAKPDPIQNEIQDLNNGLKFIQNEQDYMIQREKIHRQSKNMMKCNLSLIYLFSLFLLFSCSKN